MPEGISPNKLNDISKVYLDQVAAFREIRKQETQKDIERWSQPAQDALQKEEVQVDEEKKSLPKIKMYRQAANLARKGDPKSMKKQTKIVSVLNKETSKGYKDAALAKLRDGGSPKHQTQEDYKKLPVAKMASQISKKQFKAGQSGDVKTISKKSTETGKMIGVLDTHDPQRSKAKSKIKESFSNWRTELREVSDKRPETEKETEQRVTEKKVNNKIEINPKISEAIKDIGGKVLSIEEQDSTVVDHGNSPDKGTHGGSGGVEAKEKRQAMIKKQVLLKKLQAVRAGAGADITASYDPIEAATEYLYEEGLNEEGIDLLIEEIGLDGFVDFVEDSGFLTEEEGRPARRATVRAKKYDVVKKEVDKADAARRASKKGEYAPSYAKKETDVTDYGDDKPAAKKAPAGMKKAVARKKEVLKQPVKKVAPKPVAKKVVKAVAKVKKVQPKKPASKQGLRDKITTAYKAGVKRHKKAVQPARVFAKGFKRGVTDTVKFAKKAKKAVVGESREDRDPPSWSSMNPEDRGNPDYMKSVSYADEQKWKRLQRMRKASKKASVRVKATEEVEVGEAYKAVTNAPDSLAKMNKRYKPVKKIKNPTDRPFRDRLKDPDYKVDMDEAKAIGGSPSSLTSVSSPGRSSKSGQLNRRGRSVTGGAAMGGMNIRGAGGLGKSKPEGDERKRIDKYDKQVASDRKAAAKERAEMRKKGHVYENKAVDFIKQLVREDDAYKTTVKNLKDKFGTGVLASKKDFEDHKKREAAKPKPKAEPQKPLTDAEKAQKEVDARYGRSAWNKEGSLGT